MTLHAIAHVLTVIAVVALALWNAQIERHSDWMRQRLLDERLRISELVHWAHENAFLGERGRQELRRRFPELFPTLTAGADARDDDRGRRPPA